MANENPDVTAELRRKIADYPERSMALALFGGFAVGGGLSNRTSFQLVLLLLEAFLGDRLIPSLVPKNGKRTGNRR